MVFWQTWYWHSLNLILKKKHTRSLGLILNLVSYFYSWKWGFLGLIMTNILYKFLFCLFWSLNLQVTHEMMDFYQEFFSFFLFIYVTIQDRGDIIGYYYSTLGNSFVPCFSCRKQQENNMFFFLLQNNYKKQQHCFLVENTKINKNEIDVHSLCLSPYLFDFWDSKNGRTLNKKRNLKSFGCWSLSWSLSAKQNKQWAKSRTADMLEACGQKSTRIP